MGHAASSNPAVAASNGSAPLAGAAAVREVVAFFGDSITAAGNWHHAWPELEVLNFGIGGDTSAGLLARADAVIAAAPARLFLLIGTNDLARGETPEAIAANVAALLERFAAELPDTVVFLESVLPRLAAFQDRVLDLNARLKAVAQANGATFLDLYANFLVGDRLDPSITEDGLHLTADGYYRWFPLIDAHVRGAPLQVEAAA